MPTVLLAIENLLAVHVPRHLSSSSANSKLRVRALINSLRVDQRKSWLDQDQVSTYFHDYGAEVIQQFQGDHSDPSSWISLLEGVDIAVIQTFPRRDRPFTDELKEAHLFLAAARKVGTSHIIFVSDLDADLAHPAARRHNMHTVEEFVKKSGLRWTILRPAQFLELLTYPGFTLKHLIAHKKVWFREEKLCWITAKDFSNVIAKAILDPQKFDSKLYSVVAEIATVRDINEIFGILNGNRPVTTWLIQWLYWYQIPAGQRRGLEDFSRINRMVSRSRILAETKALLPKSTGIEEWARMHLERQKIDEVMGTQSFYLL